MTELEKLGIPNSERTKCEVWTRVMGYHRPVDSFNIGKQGEVAERKYFDDKECLFRKYIGSIGFCATTKNFR